MISATELWHISIGDWFGHARGCSGGSNRSLLQSQSCCCCWNGAMLWNKWIQYEFRTRNKTCRLYTDTHYKHSKYWIRGTSERGKLALFICTRIPEKQPLPDKLVNHSLSWIVPICEFPPPSVTASTIKSDETEASLPLVLPHQDVISSLTAYQADSNDTEWLNCVFWWISLWVIWCQIVFQFSYCSDFSVWK